MNKPIILCVLAVMCLIPAAAASAAESKHEQNLRRETARLDRTAATPQGEQAVVARLKRDFSVAGERIAALREKGLGYGEITTALSCAQSLPGGASEENVGKVLAIRQGPPTVGWGGVAQQLGIKLGRCVSQVKKVNNESHREMKADRKPHKQPETAPPPAEHPGRRAFEGEGRAMPRGSRAQ